MDLEHLDRLNRVCVFTCEWGESHAAGSHDDS